MKVNKLFLLIALGVSSIAPAQVAQQPVFMDINSNPASADIVFVIDTSVSLQARADTRDGFSIGDWRGRPLVSWNNVRNVLNNNGLQSYPIDFNNTNSIWTFWSPWQNVNDARIRYRPEVFYEPWLKYKVDGRYDNFTNVNDEPSRYRALAEVNVLNGRVWDSVVDPRNIAEYNNGTAIAATVAAPNNGISDQSAAVSNYLNWSVYASSRRKALTYGTLKAFQAIPEHFRLAYSHGSIADFQPSGLPGSFRQNFDATSDNQRNGLKLFTAAHKKGFYDWMPTMTATYASPMFDDVRYATEYLVKKKQHELKNKGLAWQSCRRPYLLYVTDYVPTRSQNTTSIRDTVNRLIGSGYAGTGFNVRPFVVVHNNALRDALIANTLNGDLVSDDVFLPEANRFRANLVQMRTEFLSSEDTATYVASIKQMVTSINADLKADASVALNTKDAGSTNKVRYTTSYNLPLLSGDLEAVAADTSRKWQASTAWDTAVDVYSLKNGGHVKVTAAGGLGSLSADQINYILGDSSKEVADNDLARQLSATELAAQERKFRRRNGPLGSIINSNLLPVDYRIDQGYRLYDLAGNVAAQNSAVAAQENTDKNKGNWLVVGANDGMLHVFNAANGKRHYAFIPPSVVPKLADYTSPHYKHQYYVDGKNILLNYYDGGWRRAIVGATGGGSKAVYMLKVESDLTNGMKFIANWERSNTTAGFSNLGHVLHEVDFGVLDVAGQKRQVVAFGNGYDSAAGVASLFVVDFKTGTKITEIVVPDSGNNGLGAVRLAKTADGLILGAYAGDLNGALWKFNFANGSVEKIFTSQGQRAITAAPLVVKNRRGGWQVVFGSGKLFEENDKTNTGDDYLYGIWDRAEFGAATNEVAINSLQTRTLETGEALSGKTYHGISGAAVDYAAGNNGWQMKLSMYDDERLIFDPRHFGDGVVFETVSVKPKEALPVGADPCDDNGGGSLQGGLYYFDYMTGLPFKTAVFDTNSDGKIDVADDANKAAVKQDKVGVTKGFFSKNADIATTTTIGGKDEYKETFNSAGAVKKISWKKVI